MKVRIQGISYWIGLYELALMDKDMQVRFGLKMVLECWNREFFKKILMIRSSLAPKWPILAPFCGMDHQKSIFLLILALFLSEAVEASRCHFFENLWMKLKCPLLLKPLATIVQENFQSVYPSEPFRIIHTTMKHPVVCRYML